MLKYLAQNGLYVVLAAILVASATAAQGQKLGDTMVYENRNQIDPKPLKMHNVHGIAKAEDGSPIPAMNVGIFTDGTHALIASTSTDQKGQFSFPHVPAGRYRRVAEHPAFCTANVPILLLDSSARGHSGQTVELHMKVGGMTSVALAALAVQRNQTTIRHGMHL